MADEAPEVISYLDRDDSFKQFPVSEVTDTWQLPYIRVNFEGRDTLASAVSKCTLQSGIIWLVRIRTPWGEYQPVKIKPACAAELLSRGHHPLPDELMIYNAPAPDPDSRTERNKKGKGRPEDTDPKRDREIADAWATKSYKTYDDLAKTKGFSDGGYVRKALDRHRKRRERSGRRRRT